RTQFDKDKA
ncbi:hypothetical protein MK338_01265, partial [Streptococcus vestibularis]|nr:hypothetical protein [Streptococcus vestibularis]